MPTSPERNPIAAPISNDKNVFDFFKSFTDILLKNKNRIIGINKRIPNILL